MGQIKYTESDLTCHVEGIQTVTGGEFDSVKIAGIVTINGCLLYTSPSPRD